MMKQDEEPIHLHGVAGQEYAKRSLVQLRVDSVNWKVLWRNPKTGNYWKEYFPQAEMHGGGPSEFVRISEREALAEFGSLEEDPAV